MPYIRFSQKKIVFLAIVASLVISLCPLDHLIPISEAAPHHDVASANCVQGACATLQSEKISLSETMSQHILPLALLSFFIPFKFQNPSFNFYMNNNGSPPLPSNKLYQLQDTYLI